MAFNNSYITNAGENLLSAAAGGEKITWIRAATSSYNVDDLTPAQMRALESIVQNDSQYTGSGNVSSHIVNNNTLTASINCQITNNVYENGGPANLFGVWAKTDTTYTSEVLVFVARRGGGAQTTISSKDVDPLFTLFVSFGIRIDEFENPADVHLTITSNYYATSIELATESTAREDFDLRTVTSHSSDSETSGDDQIIYGVKTFKNNTEHSGHVLPTVNSLNIGENTTNGRWNTVYASTFNGTTFTGTTFTGNAATATDATKLTYIDGTTKTTKLSAENSEDIVSYDDIVPDETNTYNLGSTSKPWKHIYATGSNPSFGYLIIGNSETVNAYPMIRPSQNGKGWLGYSDYKFSGVCANDFNGGKFNGTLVEDTAHSIFGIVEDGSTGPFYNGKCSTAASTTIKVVTCSGFTLANGAVITVLFTNASSLSSPSLNVNNTGAKSVVAGSDEEVTWSAGSLKTFRYSGTKWVAIKTNMVSNYGVCSTPAATAAKEVTISNSSFKLETGARVVVKLTNTNSASNPTLNVNSTGAKRIKKYSTVDPGGTAFDSWIDNSTIEFVYDGTYWVWLGYQYYAGSSLYVGMLGNANNSSYPLVFTSSVNDSTTNRVDRTLYTDTANSLYYNPSSNTLTCTTFSGSLSGNATSATSATNAANLRYSSTNVLSATSTSQVTAYGNIVPSGTRDLGTASSHWDDLFCDYIGNSSNYVTYAYITNMYGTASNATTAASLSMTGSGSYDKISSHFTDKQNAYIAVRSSAYNDTSSKYVYLFATQSNLGAALQVGIDASSFYIYPSGISGKTIVNGKYLGHSDYKWSNLYCSSLSGSDSALADALSGSGFGNVGSIRLAGLWSSNSSSGYAYGVEEVAGTSLYSVCLRTDSTMSSISDDNWDCQLEVKNQTFGNGTYKILGMHPASSTSGWMTGKRMHLVLVVKVRS